MDPPGVNQASTPCACAHSPTAAGASPTAMAIARPPSAPNRATSVGSASHQAVRKPPFRPLAPPPTMSASSRTIRVSGACSSSCQAVQSPV